MPTINESDIKECWAKVRRDGDGNVTRSIDIHGKRADFGWTKVDDNFVLSTLTTCSGKLLERLEKGIWSSLSHSSELRPSLWYGEIEVHTDGAYTLTPGSEANAILRSLTFHIDGTVTKTFADGTKITNFGACGEIVSRTESDGFFRCFEWEVFLGYQQLTRVISNDGFELERVSSNLWTRKHDGKSEVINARVEIDRDGKLKVTPLTAPAEPELFAPEQTFVSHANLPSPAATLFR